MSVKLPRYTIQDLMDATKLSRPTLLLLINGRKDRNRKPLIPDSEKRLVNRYGRWVMTYSYRSAMRVIKHVAMHSRKLRT